MAVATATFLTNYPEFAGAPASLVEAKILEAEARTRRALFSAAQADAAVMLRAAILLSHSPHARELQLEAKDAISRWERELEALQRMATMGLRTT